jgi:signal peptidase II
MRIVLLAAAIAFTADQTTKIIASATMAVGQTVPLIPGIISLTYIRNSGAAYGIFDGVRPVLIGVPMLAMAIILWHSQRVQRPLEATALGLLLGGTAGNLVDRILAGSVPDMIEVEPLAVLFRVFNLADVSVNVGAVLILFNHWNQSKRSRNACRPE